MCNGAEYGAIHRHTNTLTHYRQMRGCSVEVSDHILRVSPPLILRPARLSLYTQSAASQQAEQWTARWVEFKGYVSIFLNRVYIAE